MLDFNAVESAGAKVENYRENAFQLPTAMAPSLPRRVAAKAALPKPALKRSTVLASLTEFASVLPPTAANTSNLNPLADLVAFFLTFDVDYDTIISKRSTEAKEELLEENRQIVHSGFYMLKIIFESLITTGRLFGTLKSSAKKVKLGQGEGKKQEEGGDIEAVKNWLRGLWEDYLDKAREIIGSHWDFGVRVRRFPAVFDEVEIYPLFSVYDSRWTHVTSTHGIDVPHVVASDPSRPIRFQHFRHRRQEFVASGIQGRSVGGGEREIGCAAKG